LDRLGLLANIGARVDDGPPALVVLEPQAGADVIAPFDVVIEIDDAFGGLSAQLEIVGFDAPPVVDSTWPYALVAAAPRPATATPGTGTAMAAVTVTVTATARPAQIRAQGLNGARAAVVRSLGRGELAAPGNCSC
jgi:hypothetical protein